MSTQPVRVVLAGEFGFGNYGAEADLDVLSARLSKEHKAEPIALSMAPKETQALHGIRARHMLSPAGIVSWLKAECAVIAGGQNFDTQLYKKRNWLTLYASTLLLLRKLFGKKSQLRAVGIYYVEGLPRTLLKLALKGCDIVTARDARSEEVLKKLGCTTMKREHCPARDISPTRDAHDILESKGIPKGKQSIGFSLRRTNDRERDKRFIASIAEVADWCVSEHDLNVLFIPSCQHKYKNSENDARFMGEILSAMQQKTSGRVIKGRHSPAAIAGVCGQTIGVVTSRHHVLAFCDAAGVPSAALNISEKMNAYLQEQKRKDRALSLDNNLSKELKQRINAWNY